MSIAKGADEVVVPNLRPDLAAYGGVADVSLVWGNKKKGLVHIGKKRGVDTVLSVIRAVSAGKITKFVAVNKTVHLELDGFEAVLSLDEEVRKALDYSAVFAETQKVLRRLTGEQDHRE